MKHRFCAVGAVVLQRCQHPLHRASGSGDWVAPRQARGPDGGLCLRQPARRPASGKLPVSTSPPSLFSLCPYPHPHPHPPNSASLSLHVSWHKLASKHRSYRLVRQGLIWSKGKRVDIQDAPCSPPNEQRVQLRGTCYPVVCQIRRAPDLQVPPS